MTIVATPPPLKIEIVNGGPTHAQVGIQLLIASIPAVVAIFVVWRSNHNARKVTSTQIAASTKAAKNQWKKQRDHDAALFVLREQRTIYGSLVRLQNQLEELANWVCRPLASISEKRIREFDELLTELQGVASEIQLFGPSAVGELIYRVTGFWVGDVAQVVGDADAETQWSSLHPNAVELRMSTLAAAQSDLSRLTDPDPDG